MRRTILATIVAVALAAVPAWAQTWTAPATFTTGQLVTATDLNAQIRDNMLVLRAGGVAVTSQAIGDLLCASSTTQFARLADVATGQVVVSGGVGVCPAYSATLPTAVQDNITRLGAVVAGSFPAANLSGTALPAAVVTSSLTTVDTITTGVWNAGAVTSSGLISSTGFGLYTFTAGGTGGQIFRIRNTTAGTGNYASMHLGNDVDGDLGGMQTFSSTYTTSNSAIASGTKIFNAGVGGIAIAATNASGPIHFYAGGETEWLRLGTTGNLGLAATARLYLDGVALTGDTYLTEASANNVGIVVGDASLLITKVTSFTITEPSGAWGTGAVKGSGFVIGRNSSGNTAAGYMTLVEGAGVTRSLWVDAGHLFRINASSPTEDGAVSDTAGTVVGDQTSSLDSKILGAAFTNYAGALAEILRTSLYRFTYRDGRYGGQEFVGLVTDFSPLFGKDRDAEHPGGKSLNEITLHAYEIAAIKALAARIETLELAHREARR